MAKLDPEESSFYGRLYEAARAGCVKGLRASGCSEDEAEEIFDRVLLKVMGKADSIDRDFDPPQMVNYLKNACRNQLIDDRRQQGVLDVRDLDGIGGVSDPRGRSLDEEVAAHETVDAIYQALRSLSKRERVIFCQRNLRGWSPAEIKRSAEVSDRTYRKLIQHANEAVRTRVEASQRGLDS